MIKITYEDSEPDADFDIEAIHQLLIEKNEEGPEC
jgi:hypothetical protein